MSENDHNQEEMARLFEAQPAQAPSLPPQQWRLRDLLFFVLYIPVALLAANLAAFFGYLLLGPLAGWTAPVYKLQTNPIFLLSLQLIFYALLLASIVFLVVVYYRDRFWRALKWLKPTGREALRFFLGGIALSFLVMFAPPFLPERKAFPLEKMFSSPSSAYAVAAFAILIAPFMEELLFRGLLFAFFEKNGGLKFAIVTTAVLFAGLHIPEYWGAWNHILMIFVVGVVFSLARGMTGSVTPSFILHLAYNFTLMLAVYLQTQHFQRIPSMFHF